MKHEKQENDGAKVSPKTAGELFTTAEKAQYEVFKNGTLPRETIQKWVTADLRAIQSLVYGILNDEVLKEAVAEHYYKIYQKLHPNETDSKS